MIQPLLAVALVAISALPPHPLNQVIGGRDGNLKPRRVEQVQQNVLASSAFEGMVKQAVAHAQDPRLAQCDVLKDLNFGQRVRITLGELFSNIDSIEEWQPVNLEETIMPNRGPEPPHALDRVIGERVRPHSEVVRALRESREFAQIIRRVAEQSKPLPRGQFGGTYAETVRLDIADVMLGNLKTAAEFNERGDQSYNEGEYDLALADYNRALEQDPKNAEATSNRGWVYYQQGNLDKAGKEFDDALNLDPQWMQALTGRAYVYRDQKKYQEAINRFTKAIDISKDANQRATLYNKRGDAYYAMENYNAALADYTQSITENADKGRPHADSAWALYRLERYDEALEALDKAIALEPQKAEYWNLSGSIYRAQKDFSQAIASYGKVVQLNPQDDDGWNDLGVAHFAAGQFDEVVAALTKAIELNAQNQVYYRNRGHAYQKLGRHEQAVADFTRAIELTAPAELLELRRSSYQALAKAADGVSGLSVESYAQLFLEDNDLPAGLKQVQDARNKGPDAGDVAFEKQQGKRSGFAAWLAERKDAVVWRVVDVRFVFPTADAASEYMAASWPRLAEGATESKDAPKVGNECRVFGPENAQLKKLAKLGLASDLRAYAYVFRKQNVVVKLFVCQGPELAEPVLQPETIVPLAEKIVARIELTPAQETRPAREYFPLIPKGYVWTYVFETPEGIKHFEYELRHKNTIDGKEYQWLVGSVNDRDTMNEALRHTDQGLFLKQVGDFKFTPEWQLLPEQIQLGWQNKQELTVDDKAWTFTTSIAEKTENVKVEAGEFNAIRLTTTLQSGDETMQRDYWLVHGVGIVQLQIVQGGSTMKIELLDHMSAAEKKETEKALRDFLDEDN